MDRSLGQLAALAVIGAAFFGTAPNASAAPATFTDGCETTAIEPLRVEFDPGCIGSGPETLTFTTSAWSYYGRNEAFAEGMEHYECLPARNEECFLAGEFLEASPATLTLREPIFCPFLERRYFGTAQLSAPTAPEYRESTFHYTCRDYFEWTAVVEPEHPKPKPPKKHHPRERHKRPYWTDCGYISEYSADSVIAHRVRCAKAKRVISTLYRVSQESAPGAPIRIKSFTCVDETNARRPFYCFRGSHRIRGPVPG